MNSEREKTDEEENLVKVRNVVTRSENPSPFTMIIIILATLLVIYFVYIYQIKRLVGGQWNNSATSQTYKVVHNRWKDTLVINDDIFGFVKGNLIVIYEGSDMRMGVWLDDVVEWTNGTKWHRVTDDTYAR
jgi:hypothetical protein